MIVKNILSNPYLFTMPTSSDTRGSFVKSFSETALKNVGIEFTLRESYFSFSKKDVIRGMHFQLPPHHHSKVVFCPVGAIMDVIVDLRKDSPTFLSCTAHELSAENHKAIYIPEGFAHGFKALTDDALTYYLVSSEYNKEHDTGIRFDSIGYDWNAANPIVSARDLSFVPMNDFVSPF